MPDWIEAADASLDDEGCGAETPVMIDFAASRCGSSRSMAWPLGDMTGKYAGDFAVRAHQFEDDPQTAEWSGIDGMLVFHLLGCDEIVSRLEGAVSRLELAAGLERALSS